MLFLADTTTITDSLMPWLVISVGVIAAALFFFYFMAGSDRPKRILGTLLAVVLTGFSIFLINLGLKQGIDLKGGASFLVQVKPGEGKAVDPSSIKLTQSILEKRLNPQGTRDVTVTPQGTDRLYLEVPGISDEEIKITEKEIAKVAKLELRLLHPDGFVLVEESDTEIRPGYSKMEYVEKSGDEKEKEEKAKGPKKFLWVKNKSELPGKSVANAVAHPSAQGSDYEISVRLHDEYDDVMRALTAANIEKPMAIALDNQIISAPRINGIFGKDFQITGSFTDAESARLANVLMNPLENPLVVLQGSTISPTYGEATVKQGLYSALAGLALTLLFMMVYYRLSGIIAVVGLVVNLLLLLGAMKVFDFTLTMPGIAGMILTLGMAVDANVLIYERMREEFAAGRNFTTAINASYSKAFSAIFDSNITTLITSVIMMLLASGAIYGFGLSLTIGLIASMFSALVITRVCFLWLSGWGLKKLSFLSLIENKLYNFMGKRKRWLTISAIACTACIAIVAFKGKNALGYELRGGDIITLAASDIKLDEVEKSVANWSITLDGAHYEASNVNVGTVKPLTGGENIILRSPPGTAKSLKEQLTKDLATGPAAASRAQTISNASTDTMGSAVGDSMMKKSILAIVLGLIGIFIYLTFRFEMPFAIGGIVAIFHDVIIAVGVCALFGKEIGLILVGAFLTIAGYSINDTIVIFDRVRECLRTMNDDLEDVLNHAISATLSRTIITSGVTALAVLAMFIFGGKALGDFSFAMLIGMLSGTYSTIFIASPVVLWWARRRQMNLRNTILDADAARAAALDGSGIEREAPSTQNVDYPTTP